MASALAGEVAARCLCAIPSGHIFRCQEVVEVVIGIDERNGSNSPANDGPRLRPCSRDQSSDRCSVFGNDDRPAGHHDLERTEQPDLETVTTRHGVTVPRRHPQP